MKGAATHRMSSVDHARSTIDIGERVAGCDLGKSTAKFLVGRLRGGALTIEAAETIVHQGHPFDVFRDWYEREQIGTCVSLGATGAHASGLLPPIVAGLPE